MALLIAAIGWILLLAHLKNLEKAAEEEALRQTAASAVDYSEQLGRVVESVDEFSLYIRQAWNASDGAFRLEQWARNKAASNRWPFNVAIIGADGNVISSRTQLPASVNLSGTEFFEVQKRAGQDFLYVSAPGVSPLDNQEVVHFTRRLNGADGAFAGAVMVCIPVARLTAGYNPAALGQYGFMGTFGTDGALRATRTGNQIQHIGQFVVPTNLSLGGNASGTFDPGDSGFTDGHSRYVSWRKVESYPLVAVVGLERGEKMAPYWAARRSAIESAVWVTAALMLFKFIAMGLTVRLAWHKHRVERVQATYRIATEEGSEGFYIARPVRASGGAIADFSVIDCNQRGAEFFRMSRDQLIGQNVYTLYNGRDPARLMNALCYADKYGSFEDEIEVRTEDLLTTRWLHLKIVRADGDLAIRLRDVSAAKAHIRELERQASEDVLTKLPNRQWVLRYLPDAIEAAAQRHSLLALLFLDLDGFKLVNDTMGHGTGDELLQLVARRLKVAVRPGDHVARLGGDEFVVLVESIHHARDAINVTERVLHAFQENFRLAQGTATIGTSIGISMYPKDGATTEALLKHADIAMYAVKGTRKGGYQFYDDNLYDALKRRVEREAELRQALDCDQLIVHYQPRVDLLSGKVVGMEALARWQHPSRGLLHPAEFIPMAEQTGLITKLGETILDKVCAQIARWRSEGRRPVPVSVNVSPRQFTDSDLPCAFTAALGKHRVEPSLLEIELTESLMMADTPDIGAALARLHAMGIKFLVDDFGAGYSSLSQLQRLDFDVLKVDKAFTADIEDSEQGNVFFAAIITMAHALGMRVVAEGVENRHQIRILKSLQCDELQGFYIAPPMPGDDALSAPQADVPGI